MNPFFNWLKDTGTQAMLVLVGTVAAIVAAFATIFFGLKSLTRKDLEQVESNTAHLEEVRYGISNMNARLIRQETEEELKLLATRVFIVANGENQAGLGLYQLQLQVRHQPDGTNVSLTQIELLNERDTPFGSFPCTSTGNPGFFRVDIPMNTIGAWFNSGTPVANIFRTRLKVRVMMSINGVGASRDVVVQVVTSPSMPGYSVESV